jgi:hypothetical protein
MDRTEIEELTKRLDRLECENRALKRRSALLMRGVSVIALAAVLTFASGARLAGVPKVIEAEKFILRDAGGAPRAELLVQDNGVAGLVLLGPGQEDKSDALQLVANTDGTAVLLVKDKQGQPRLTAGVSSDGTPVVGLMNAEGKERVALAVKATGVAGLVLRDSDAKTRISLSVCPDGNDWLRFDRQGNRRAGLGVFPDGGVALNLFDRDGKGRINQAVRPDGRAGLWFADPTGQDRLKLESESDGSAGLVIFREKGQGGLSLSNEPHGLLGLGIRGPGDRPRIGLGLRPDGSAGMAVRNLAGATQEVP